MIAPRISKWTASLLILFSFSGPLIATTQDETKKRTFELPNILLIVADDLGY